MIIAGFGLQFEEREDVLNKVPSLAGRWVVLGHLVLVKFVYLEYAVAALDSRTSSTIKVAVKALSEKHSWRHCSWNPHSTRVLHWQNITRTSRMYGSTGCYRGGSTMHRISLFREHGLHVNRIPGVSWDDGP